MTALLEKRCSKCGIVKNINQFHKDKRNKDGLETRCMACRQAYRRANPVLVQTRNMLSRARRSAKEKKLHLDIDLHYIRSIVPSHCPIFGVKLEWSAQRGNGSLALPNSPSIDRIDPSKGYVKGNIWIISFRANAIKNDASHEELKLVTEAVGRAIVNSLDW